MALVDTCLRSEHFSVKVVIDLKMIAIDSFQLISQGSIRASLPNSIYFDGMFVYRINNIIHFSL